MVNKYIFREYDIRGKVVDDFPPQVVNQLGKGFGTFVKRSGFQELALSGDIRLTTPKLMEEFKNGVLSTGVDVINLGILPTPANYYSMFKLEVGGAVQITGSHNPPEFNGFKMSLDRKAVYGKDIQTLRKYIDNNDFDIGNGNEIKYDIKSDYKSMIIDKINIERTMKVVMDCGNAAGAINAPDIFRNLNIDLTELYCDPDGTFPNHHPDPTVKENLKDLIDIMKSGNHDIGIAFDGDADRVGVVDETGDIIWADQLMALFLPEVIQNNDEILFDVKCSQALEDMIIRYGGKPVMWKTGHSLIKQKMNELGCKLGGEMSGHICFADNYYGFDDAIYAACRVLQILAQSNNKLSEMLADLPKTSYTPEIRVDCPDEKKFEIVRELTEIFRKQFEVIDIDGVRINFDGGWALIRASNTQPVLVLRFEAVSEERLKQLVAVIKKQMENYKSIIQFDYEP